MKRNSTKTLQHICSRPNWRIPEGRRNDGIALRDEDGRAECLKSRTLTTAVLIRGE
jgi:hypothetical protein